MNCLCNWILCYEKAINYQYCGLNIHFGPTAVICTLALSIKSVILVIGIIGNSHVLKMAVIKCAK